MNNLQDEAFTFGQTCAPLFINFCLWILEQSQKYHLNSLFFITREGTFFLKLTTLLNEKFKINSPINFKLLETSRLASYAPTIELTQEKPFHQLWTIYPNQSIRVFLASLGIPSDDFISIAKNHSIELNQVINDIENNRIFQNFLNRNEVQSLLKIHLAKKRKLLTEYLDNINFFNNEKIGIIDIGWRGSIQNNLAKLAPQHSLYGFYLGLHSYKTSTPLNCEKQSFIFNPNINKQDRWFACLMRYVLPLEFLCSDNEGSVIGYKKNTDEKILAIRTSSTEENILIEKYALPFQQGVFSIAEALNNQEKFNRSIQDCRKIAKTITWNPQNFLMDFYNHLSHQEPYGEGRSLTTPELLTIKELTYLFTEKRQHTIQKLKKCYWLAAYLKLSLPRTSHYLQPFLPTLYLLFCLITHDTYL